MTTLLCTFLAQAGDYTYLVFTNTAGTTTAMTVDGLTMTVNGTSLQVTNTTGSVNITLTDTYNYHIFIMARHYDGVANLFSLGVVGSRIDNVTFLCKAETREKVYVIVEIEGQDARIIDVTDIYVPGDFLTVDISGENIIIPENAWVRIGYGMEGLDTSEYGFSFYGFSESVTDGGYIAIDFWEKPITWYIVDFGNIYGWFVISAKTSSTRTLSFADLGAAYISIENGVPTIVPSKDRTVYKTEWLQEGPKTYIARVTYYDGTTERVYLDLE